MAGFCERLLWPPPTQLASVFANSAASSILLVGQLTRLPFHSGYATGVNKFPALFLVYWRNQSGRCRSSERRMLFRNSQELSLSRYSGTNEIAHRTKSWSVKSSISLFKKNPTEYRNKHRQRICTNITVLVPEKGYTKGVVPLEWITQ